MVLFEDLTRVVLWLLATVTAINLVFLFFVFFRRLARKRYYTIRDSARERYQSVISGFQSGHAPVELATKLLADATSRPERDAVEELLLDAFQAGNRERLTDLALGAGYLERWAMQAFGRRRGREVVRSAIQFKTPPPRAGKLVRAMNRILRLRMMSVPRAIATDHLGWSAPSLARIFLSEALADPSLEVRSTAIAVIGRNADRQAIPQLVDELAQAVQQKNQISLRSIKIALVSYDIDDLPYFVPYLAHELPRVRFFLVDAISQICNDPLAQIAGHRSHDSSRRSALRIPLSSVRLTPSRHRSSSVSSSRASRGILLNKNDFSREFYEVFLGRMVNDEFADVRARCAGVIRHFRDRRTTEALRAELARVLSWAGRNSESIAEYRALLKQNPDDIATRLGLARVLSWDKQPEEALSEYERVLKQDPHNRDALFERARTFAWKGDYGTAIRMYDSILIHAPTDNEVLLAKAQALNWSGEPHEAGKIIAEIQKVRPDDRDVTLANAAVQSSLGRRDLALRLLDNLDKLQPGNHDVDALRQSIVNDMRPVLLLGFTPSFDSGDTAIYASRTTFYFSPHPQVRSYLSVNFIPSYVPTALHSETGREFLFGSYGRVNSRLQLRGEIGANASSAGMVSPIGSVGATLFATDKIQLEFDVSRRFINYLPQPILFEISRIQYRGAVNWRATKSTTLHGDYFHEQYSDTNQNDGGNVSIMQNVVNRERVKLQVGYLFAISGFDHEGHSGFFTPTSFMRHAAVGNTQVKLSKDSALSFWGSLGREEVFDQAFRWDGTARAAWDYQLTPKLKSSVGYGYFAVSSIGGSTAYITHTMFSTFQYTF